MSEAKRQENNFRLAVLMTVAVFCMGQIPGSIDAAIAKISIAFNLTSTSGMYVSTVACLVGVVFSILLGFIAGKKVGFKPLLFFCATIELVAGVLPFFVDNFVVLLVLRGCFGVGFGGMMSMENTVTAKLITPAKRARILGMGMFFGFGMNCVLQFVGGVLADSGWNYVFLNHLILLIPYVIVIIGCLRLDFNEVDAAEAAKKEQEEAHARESAKAEEKQKKAPGGLNGPVFQIWVMMLFVGCMISPLLIGVSFLSEELNDSATVAGIAAVCFSVGCMIGGLTYPKIYEKLQRAALPLFLVITAAGLIGSGLSRSVVVLCILCFVSGWGFSMTQSMGMMILTIKTSPERIAFASALMMALFNLGVFFSSTFENIIGRITGDALYTPLYVGAVILVIFAVVYLIFSPLKGRKVKEA